MALADFLNKQATITAEAPDGQVPPQDALGGADRSDDTSVTVAAGVPCGVWEQTATLILDRDGARTNLVTARIYFAVGSLPVELSSRHRITVGTAVYTVKGAIARRRQIEVDCERVRTS